MAGAYYGRVWYFRDVTERKQYEKTLRLERDKAQRYLDTASVILLTLNMTGQISMVNRHACDVLGWTAEELLGRDFIDACVPGARKPRDKLRGRQPGDDSVVENPVVTRGATNGSSSGDRRFRDGAGRVTGT